MPNFMEFHLKQIIEALLFSTSEILSIREIQDVILQFQNEEKENEAPDNTDSNGQQVMLAVMSQVPALTTATQIREAIEELSQTLLTNNSVYCIVKHPEGYKMTIAPAYSEWVRLLRKEPKPLKLSQSLMETLAIIAYRQPVTRSEIEAIRGVSVDNAINKLTELSMINVLGRADLPGRPMQYGTTETFLQLCGIQNLSELPASDILPAEKINLFLNKNQEPQDLTDKDVGLAEEIIPETASHES